MNWLMQGFLIAIFVILSGVFIRLGLILDEIKGKQTRDPTVKSCITCENYDAPASSNPCYSCLTSDLNLPEWEGKE